jgi:hypothetical protein
MIELNSSFTGNPGENRFSAARKTGKFMGINLADDDPQIGFENRFVDLDRRPVGGFTQPGQFFPGQGS